MKPGLSLRVSQHLALTPQLQQSIRLLQLSTLELASEVEQMLDDNPFLERDDEAAPREEFGLARADTRVSEGDRIQESASDSIAVGTDSAGDEADFGSESLAPESWDGDGSSPEPRVCLTINGVRSCTPTIQDTYSPVWNAAFPAATATALQAGVFSEYIDVDSFFDDPICSGSIPVTQDEFQRGIWGFRCISGVGQVDATLTAQ